MTIPNLLFCFLLAIWIGIIPLQHEQETEDVPLLRLEPELIYSMAQVAKGESGVAPETVACVMRNRILAGWNPYKVLNHFYAPPRPVTIEELQRVTTVLRTGYNCDRRAYFQWSRSDVAKIQPCASSFLYEAHGNFFYDREALRCKRSE
jgi:hypothetical protein